LEIRSHQELSGNCWEIRRMRMVRLCHEANTQGGLLSGVDQHEKQTNTVIPHRATVHDMGSGVIHKRISERIDARKDSRVFHSLFTRF